MGAHAQSVTGSTEQIAVPDCGVLSRRSARESILSNVPESHRRRTQKLLGSTRAHHVQKMHGRSVARKHRCLDTRQSSACLLTAANWYVRERITFPNKPSNTSQQRKC